MDQDYDSISEDSPPQEPELSQGSSVSLDLQNECDQLVEMTIKSISQNGLPKNSEETKEPPSEDEDVSRRSQHHDQSQHSKHQKTAPIEKKTKHLVTPGGDTTDRFEQEMLLLEPSGSDDEVVRLENIIDGWSFDLKRNILAEYNQSKYRLKGLVKKIVDEEKTRLHTTLQELRDQVVSLQDLAKSYQDSLSRKDQVVEGLAKEIAKQREKVQLSHKFANWRQLREEKKREDFCMALAARYHRHRLAGRALYLWKEAVAGTWKGQVERRCELQAQQVCRQLGADYEDKVAQLEAQLAAAHRATDDARAAHRHLEEEMKQALMRGVCALNMETMTVLSGVNGASGSAGVGDLHHQDTPRAAEVTPRSYADRDVDSLNYPRAGTLSTPQVTTNSNKSLHEPERDEVPRHPPTLPPSSSFGLHHSAPERWLTEHSAPGKEVLDGTGVGSLHLEGGSRTLPGHKTFLEFATDQCPSRSSSMCPLRGSYVSYADTPAETWTAHHVLFDSSPRSPAHRQHTTTLHSDTRHTSTSNGGSTTPGTTVTAQGEARRHLTSRVVVGEGSRGGSGVPAHLHGGVLTVRADNPSGSALHSASGVASVLVEKHQPVNKRTLGPVITSQREASTIKASPEPIPICRRLAGQGIFTANKY